MLSYCQFFAGLSCTQTSLLYQKGMCLGSKLSSGGNRDEGIEQTSLIMQVAEGRFGIALLASKKVPSINEASSGGVGVWSYLQWLRRNMLMASI